MRLFSYKMTHDTGFAPNPFHKKLTLATCKPDIRLRVKENDWIAGFTSQKLNGDKVGEERLVYLMKVDYKVPFEKYWESDEFQIKKPNPNLSVIYKAGDNVYEPTKKSPDIFDFKHSENSEFHKDDKELQHKDLRGRFVLISSDFYYFGGKPLEIDAQIRPDLINRARYGALTKDVEKAQKFIEYISHKFSKGGLIHMPTTWPEQDKNTKTSTSCK